jgi:hypothetical protein
MEYATFRKWLAEHGYRLGTQSEKRGEGHGTVTIHRAGRTAELPLVGARHNLDRVRFAKSAKHSAGLAHGRLANDSKPGRFGSGSIHSFVCRLLIRRLLSV